MCDEWGCPAYAANTISKMWSNQTKQHCVDEEDLLSTKLLIIFFSKNVTLIVAYLVVNVQCYREICKT